MNKAEREALIRLRDSLQPNGLRLHGSGIARRVQVTLLAQGLIELDRVYLRVKLTPAGVEAARALQPDLTPVP
jgi:hypothetical protein